MRLFFGWLVLQNGANFGCGRGCQSRRRCRSASARRGNADQLYWLVAVAVYDLCFGSFVDKELY